VCKFRARGNTARCAQELRNDYNLARVDQRSLEKLTSDKKHQQRLFKLKETTTTLPTTTSSVTVVNVNSSEAMITTAASTRDVTRGAEVIVGQQRSSGGSTAVTTTSGGGSTTANSSQYNVISGGSYLPQSIPHITRLGRAKHFDIKLHLFRRCFFPGLLIRIDVNPGPDPRYKPELF
jgi:archaellum component FlaF (FlaF/FlaG flagellin family)